MSHELGEQLEFLAYCLMPNHFHLLVSTKSNLDSIKVSNALRTLLSSYTRAIQKQENMTGSLFQQNTKAKELINDEYASSCFHYIHQNPYRSQLVDKIENWPYHSFNEYWKNAKGICNVDLGRSLIHVPPQADYFYKESYRVMPDQFTREIF
jgi:REP element-mobilizing transposase RayT